MSSAPSILVGEIDDHVWIRVLARGTFEDSRQLKDLVTRLLAAGRRRFVIDLAECPAMDSTFMGTLTGISLSLAGRREGGLVVVNANERNLALLRGLGLDQILDIDTEGTRLADQRRKAEAAILDTAPDSGPAHEDAHRAHVLAAHETLSQTNEENRRRFRDVVTFLRGDLGNAAGR